MKKLILFGKKYLGELLTIMGTGISVYNVFNFSYRTYGKIISEGLLPKLPSLGPKLELEGIAYYYSSDTLWLISIGAMLIILGLIMMKYKAK
jgi:hypothetical protein